MINGVSSQLPLSRRRRPTRSQFLLVEMPSDIDTDGAREELLTMYKAAEGAARRTSPAAILNGRESTGNNNDGGRRQTLSIGSLAHFVCPYFGVLRVRVGTEATSSQPQGSTINFGSPQPSARPGEGGQEKTRLFLALGDPREGMRSPCTLTIKIATDNEAASVPPPQVHKILESQRHHTNTLLM